MPYRTEVNSKMNRGKQNITGILGPVRAVIGFGDIKASYISKGLQAHVEDGNLDIQVIGEHVEAKAGVGNISCSRIAQGASAETGDGDINLTVVGPSTATIKKGAGELKWAARGAALSVRPTGEIFTSVPYHTTIGSSALFREVCDSSSRQLPNLNLMPRRIPATSSAIVRTSLRAACGSTP